jgi:DNA repair protein RadC
MNYADMMEACASYIAVKNPTIKEPSKVFDIMAPLFQNAKQESLFIIMLDTKSKIIGAPCELFRGLLDSCPTHPREVFRLAIRDCAAALIIVHITQPPKRRPDALTRGHRSHAPTCRGWTHYRHPHF